MTDHPILKYDEGVAFIRLFKGVIRDINQAKKEADEIGYNERESTEFIRRWGATPEEVRNEYHLQEYKEFARHAYLSPTIGDESEFIWTDVEADEDEITESFVRNIKMRFDEGETPRQIAVDSSAGLATVRYIITGSKKGHIFPELTEKNVYLDEDTVAEIKYDLQNTDIIQQEISEKYGVSPSSVSKIATGKIYEGIEPANSPLPDDLVSNISPDDGGNTLSTIIKERTDAIIKAWSLFQSPGEISEKTAIPEDAIVDIIEESGIQQREEIERSGSSYVCPGCGDRMGNKNGLFSHVGKTPCRLPIPDGEAMHALIGMYAAGEVMVRDAKYSRVRVNTHRTDDEIPLESLLGFWFGSSTERFVQSISTPLIDALERADPESIPVTPVSVGILLGLTARDCIIESPNYEWIDRWLGDYHFERDGEDILMPYRDSIELHSYAPEWVYRRKSRAYKRRMDLLRVIDHMGWISLKDLSKEFSWAPGTIRSHVADLNKNGIVVRRRNDMDERIIEYNVNEKLP